MTLDPKRVGCVLRTFRESQGLTQSEVADRLGLSEQGYAHYESGRVKRFALHDVSRFAMALDVTLPELMEALDLQEPQSAEPTVDMIVRDIRSTPEIADEHKAVLVQMIQHFRTTAPRQQRQGNIASNLSESIKGTLLATTVMVDIIHIKCTQARNVNQFTPSNVNKFSPPLLQAA